jgi:hypothetical protein
MWDKIMGVISESFLRNNYYYIKPFIPRWLQIKLRRRIILRKRLKYSDVWPIDEKAGKPPEGWSGWPEKKQFALVLTHDVETEKGQKKCYQLIELEENFGFRSSFNFVPKRYEVSSELRNYLVSNAFEVGMHGLYHDGKLYKSRKIFLQRAKQINYFLNEWQSVGFRSPSMGRNLDWIRDLNIEYDASTFDTDPFEPQPEGVATIFPFLVPGVPNPQPEFGYSEPGTRNPKPETVLRNGYIELPYTLPQDFTLFVLMKEKGIDIWKRKLDWIVKCGGMALLITHPDYMNFDGKVLRIEEYPSRYYEEFLEYIRGEYKDQCWSVLPKEMARFWANNHVNKRG